MDKEASQLKGGLYNVLKEVTGSLSFSADADVAQSSCPIGVHSTKKYTTTCTRRSGVPNDFVDYRAR